MENKWICLVLVSLVIILNIIDASATIWFLNRDLATELNPISDYLIKTIGNWFILYKAFLTFLFGFIIYFTWNLKISRMGLYSTSVIYLFICLYHLYGYNFLIYQPI